MNKENIEQYCPNTIFNNGIISIGEFKTLQEAMNFPIKQVWCVNRDEDNKFQAYKNQGTRILIICDWNKSIQDATKFVVGLVFINGEIKYFDLNDIPLDSKQYENSIGHDAYSAIYSVADDNYRNNNEEIKENRKMNKKQTIRLNESQFNNLVTEIVKESVKRVLKENAASYGYGVSSENYTEVPVLRWYTQGIIQVYSQGNKFPSFFIDSKGYTLNKNGERDMKAGHVLCDNDASKVADEASQMFKQIGVNPTIHWDLYRRTN